MPAVKLNDRNDVELKPGDVFFWYDYPYQKDHEEKDRPFIYLGGIQDSDRFYLFMMRTITSVEYPPEICMELKCTEVKCLSEDSRIVFTYPMDTLSDEEMAFFTNDLKKIGSLPLNRASELVHKIERLDKHISGIQLKAIRLNLQEAGYTIK